MDGNRILIVEDEAIIAMELESRLKSLGHRPVGIATTGKDALAIAESESPELALMDISIQGELDGIDTAAEVAKLYDIPVVFLTAYADDATLLRAKAVQPYGYLIKPLRERELAVAIEFALLKHRAEREIREAKAQFERVVNNIREGLIVDDREGRLVYANDEFLKLFGIKREDLLSVSLEDYVAPEWRELLRERHDRRMRGEAVPSEFEYEGIRRDGRRMWLSVTVAEVRDGAKLIGTQTAIRDVSFAKAAQEELLRREKQLSDAQRLARLGSWEWSINEKLSYWSDEMQGILGEFSAQPVAASSGTYIPHIHPDDLEVVKSAIAASLRSGKSLELEHRYIRPDGEVIYLQTYAEVTRNAQGEPERMAGTSQDITERRQNEQERISLERKLLQVQRLESLGVLAGGIAHDFNNLLAAILGNVNLAQECLNTSQDALPYLLEAETASLRAAELTRQMLAYSGRGRFLIEPHDLSALVREMAHILEVSISKKVRLTLDTPAGLPPVEGDATQLRQVVMNLITNASDAIGDDPGAVNLSTALMDVSREELLVALMGEELAPGKYLALRVEDTGCGMDEETRQRIFDPFFTTKFTGRGLGLASVIGIVRSHGGALAVSSEPGKGTVFTIWLPITDKAPSVKTPAAQAQTLWRQHDSLLLIEDELPVQRMAATMLGRLGFTVFTADDGREGLEQYRAHQDEIKAVVLDLTMPAMDGTQVYVEIRRNAPKLPVVIASGFSESDVADRIDTSGPVSFLEKPYTQDSLSQKIAEAYKLASLASN